MSLAMHLEESLVTLTRDYRGKGYAIVRQVLGEAEIELLGRECNRLYAELEAPSDAGRIVSRQTLNGEQRPDRLDPVRDISPAIARLTEDPRVVTLAETMMGEPVLLMKDKIIFKNPGVHGYDVHQDYHVWQELPPPAEAMLSVLVAVDEANEQNGAVTFYPGLHNRPLNPEDTPRDLFKSGSGVVPAEYLEGRPTELAGLAPGDAVVFSSLAPHFSAPNRTGLPRRALFFTYNAARFGNLYEQYYAKFRFYRERDRAAAVESEPGSSSVSE